MWKTQLTVAAFKVLWRKAISFLKVSKLKNSRSLHFPEANDRNSQLTKVSRTRTGIVHTVSAGYKCYVVPCIFILPRMHPIKLRALLSWETWKMKMFTQKRPHYWLILSHHRPKLPSLKYWLLGWSDHLQITENMCSLVNIAFTFHADSDRIRSLWNEMLSGECVEGRKKIQYTYLHKAISISRF